MGKIYCEPQMFLGYIDNDWDQVLRVVLYLAGLLYCFVGISIIADIFMASIEVITSKERVVTLPDSSKITVKTWNATVANLTLMALGSSAPEILLSVIEILSGGFFSGALGPSTIVGSAAFNLMFISAVCVVAVPPGEARTLNQLGVFFITAGFSIFAYVWLILILMVWTPDRVTVVEGVLTALFFPLLVILCYLVDAGYLDRLLKRNLDKVAPDDAAEAGEYPRVTGVSGSGDGQGGGGGKEGGAAAGGAPSLQQRLGRAQIKTLLKANAVRLRRGQRASLVLNHAEEIKEQLKAHLHARHGGEGGGLSRARLHMNACRLLSGKPRKAVPGAGPAPAANAAVAAAVAPAPAPAAPMGPKKEAAAAPPAAAAVAKEEGGGLTKGESHEIKVSPGAEPALARQMSVQEMHANCAVSFAVGKYRVPCVVNGQPPVLRLTVTRRRAEIPLEVRYGSADGTAAAGRDYAAAEGLLAFAPGQLEAHLEARLLAPPQAAEAPQTFTLRLLDEPYEPSDKAMGWLQTVCEVTIEPEGAEGAASAGKLGFLTTHTGVDCYESDQFVALTVTRIEGYSGSISCSYQCTDLTARHGQDYIEVSGDLVFGDFETQKQIWVEILDDQEFEKDETFKVSIQTEDEACTHGKPDAIVTILNDDVIADQIHLITRLLNMDLDMYRIGSASWREQIRDALEVGAEPGEKPTARDWALHLVALPWKLFFALVPPTAYCQGKLTFVVALGGIALVTILVGDLASLLGCVMGLKDSVTAITFVALGTSLPDTFASMSAAKLDKYADNSIGNITGSNSVNVFLGIGLPWAMAAIYWAFAGRTPAWEAAWGGTGYAALYPGGGFIVESGDLGLSVIVFTLCALLTLGAILLRRKIWNAELGGPETPKKITGIFFVFLWFLYIIVSSLKAYGYF